MFSVYFKDNSAERRKQGNPKSRSNPNGQRETQFGAHSLQRQIGPLMKTTSKPFSRGLLWADTVKRKKVAVAIIYIMTILSGILFGENDSEMFAVFFYKIQQNTICLIAFTRGYIHSARTPCPSAVCRSCSLFFYAFLIQSETPAACVHIWAIGFFHFLLVFLSLPQLWTFRTTPLTDAWQAGDELAQEHVGAQSSEPPAAAAASPSLPLSSSLFHFSSVSLPSLAPSLEQTLWRRRRDVTPFTAALEPALPAPLRRFPWQRGFGLRGGSQLIDLGPNRGFGSFLLRWWPRSFK